MRKLAQNKLLLTAEADLREEEEASAARGRFPDTPPHKISQKLAELAKRRAANKIARESRRKNFAS